MIAVLTIVAGCVAYLLFCAGLYFGQQPFGHKWLARLGWPLLRIKRLIFGVDPLLVDYGALPTEKYLFDGAISSEFEGCVLEKPNLAMALPANVSPRLGAATLAELLTVTSAGVRGDAVRQYRTVAAGAGMVRHVFDLGWSQAELLSDRSELADCVSIIVPGSGFDEASQIVRRTGYHESIVDQFVGDKLVYVRPNNDSRQIVYGGKRANFDNLFTTLIGINSIYSYWFVQELISVVSYLRAQKKTVVIGGLSQGGGTSLLVGAVTDANLTVVMSGYYDPTCGMLGNYHQILIPGLWPFLQPNCIGPLFVGRGLLLSYGEKDLPIYRYEAENRNMSAALAKHVTNFRCIVHPGGHTYPENLRSLAMDMLQLA